MLYDVIMPYTGTYYVKVSTYAPVDANGITHDTSVGNYDLFAYSFAAVPPGGATAAAAPGDTLIGGSGGDTLVGSSAADSVFLVPGDTFQAGSGGGNLDVLPNHFSITDPPVVDGSLPLRGTFVVPNPSQTYTYRWHVDSSNGLTIPDVTGTVAVTNGTGLATFDLPSSVAGVYTVTLTVTDSIGGSNSASVVETLTSGSQAPPPLTDSILDANGAPEPAQVVGALNAPLTVSAGLAGGFSGVTYSWAVTPPPGAPSPTLTYTYDGNGLPRTVSFNEAAAGTYIVTLTATDSAREAAVATLSVVVPAIPPSAQIAGVPANDYEAEGQAFTLASIVSNPQGTPLTSSWTVVAGDGSERPYTVTGSSLTYTPDDIGSYTVTLNLLDPSQNNKVVATVTQPIISIGVAPTATLTGGTAGATIPEGTAVSFSGSASSPSTVTASKGFYYTWNVSLFGQTYATQVTATPVLGPNAFAFTPGQAGVYTVTLEASDYHGYESLPVTQTVNVASVAPAVTITGQPAGGTTVVGTRLALGSTVSNPSQRIQNAGYAESWTVQFGGVTYGPYTGPTLNLTAGGVGNYTVTLTALDAEGVSGSTSQTFSVTDVAPTVTPPSGPPQTASQANLTAYNLGSVSGPGLSFGQGAVSIDWGDGTTPTAFPLASPGSLGSQSHAYDLPGTYHVKVTVTDPYGAQGTASFTTSVTPVAPVPTILNAPAAVTAGTPIVLGSSVSDRSKTETNLGFTYSWSVTSNGQTYTLPANSTDGPGLSFTPQAAGTYAITLATTDSSGTTGTSPPQTITVAAAAASRLAITGLPVFPATQLLGQPVPFTVTAYDPYGNVATGYAGNVTLTSSGGTVTPGTYTFTSTDKGTHLFTRDVHHRGSPDDHGEGRRERPVDRRPGAGRRARGLHDVPSVITGIVQDTGGNPAGGLSVARTFTLYGTAEPDSTLTINLAGTAIGTAYADVSGAWTFSATPTGTGPYGFTVSEAPFGPLGIAGGFNLFSLGTASVTGASVSGRLAAAGNVTVNQSSIATSEPNSNGTVDELIAGGNLSLTSSSVNGGNVVYQGTGTITSSSTSNGTARQDRVINFAAAQTYLDGESTALAALGLTPNGTWTSAYGTLTLKGTDSQRNVFSVPATTLASSSQVTVNVPAGSFTVIDVTGGTAGAPVSVTLHNMGFSLKGADAKHVVWNVSRYITGLTITQTSFSGSVLAPWTALTLNSASLQGTLVAGTMAAVSNGSATNTPLTVAEPALVSAPYSVIVNTAYAGLGAEKFFVLDSGGAGAVYGYDSQGTPLPLDTSASVPAGPKSITSDAAGNRYWLIDAAGDVSVYDRKGNKLGTWQALGLANPTLGIAQTGHDLWVLDAGTGNGLGSLNRYSAGSTMLTGNETRTNGFTLAAGDTDPVGVATDGATLWVVDAHPTNANNAAHTPTVFVYSCTSQTLLGSWTLGSDAQPTGITNNPAVPPSTTVGSDLWVVDAGGKSVYDYATATILRSGSAKASGSFSLATADGSPVGIADPPVPGAALTSASAPPPRPDLARSSRS